MRYEFECEKCVIIIEHYLPITEGPGSIDCPKCGEKMRHLLGCNFILKGDNWAGKDLKKRERAMDKSREENDAQLDEDNSNQRIVEEVTAVRRQGSNASRKLREENPQKMKDYKKAIKRGYRAKPKSYNLKVKK